MTPSLPRTDSPTGPCETAGHIVLSRFVVLFGLIFLTYLGTTGFLPLMGRDEPRYVQIGREMLDSGDWITPHLGGFTWFEKPVLLYWMVAASFGVFGASEWAARLGPALCGLGTVALVWWLARATSEKWANWSAIALATCGGMLAFSHGATFDIVLTFCLTLALAAWWKAQAATDGRTKLLALFWCGVGLAFMAKGLVAFVLPLGTIWLYALARRERVKVGLWWGLPLALVVSAIWYGPVIRANGASFVNEFFVQHQFERFTSNKFRHHQPPWFYLEMLPLLALPWTPFLLVALAKMRAGWRVDSPEARLRAFGLAWMIVPIAFFSISGSKLPSYILPALPGAFLLVGSAISEWSATPGKKYWATGIAASMLLLGTVITTFGVGVARAEQESVRRMFEVAHTRNLGGLRVAQFQTTQRTAEFYAASHLLYDNTGEPLTLQTPTQVERLARHEPLLVLSDDGSLPALQSPDLRLDKIAHNGKTWLLLARTAP